MQQEQTTNATFSTKLGLIMATAGSAVGLGNIWKFPYIAGENGGGAFLIIYLVCVLLFGLPLLMVEFIIGKHSGKSAYGAFRELTHNNRWQWLSWSCLLTPLIITGFYFVVTGWCLNYLTEAITNTFNNLSATQLTENFENLQNHTLRMFGYSILAVLLTAAVLWFDVNKGIERLSKILMPLLLLMMLLMAGRVLMLPGSNVGMSFFFEADFSKITPDVVLSAMGQCFFSLSIGMGALITYGAYMPKRQNITVTSLQVVILDTLVALLAGIIIFPAVFAFGFDPAEGPELVFVVLPAIFEQMSFSWFSSVLFFTLLGIAAITSTISLMEVVVAFLTEATAHRRYPLNRHKAVLITAALCIVMISVCILSISGSWQWLVIAGHDMFYWFDKVTSCFLMPINALAMTLFVGWILQKKDVKTELETHHNIVHRTYINVFWQLVRFFVPIAILAIFLNGIGIFTI